MDINTAREIIRTWERDLQVYEVIDMARKQAGKIGPVEMEVGGWRFVCLDSRKDRLIAFLEEELRLLDEAGKPIVKRVEGWK